MATTAVSESWAAEQGAEFEKEPIGTTSDPAARGDGDGKVYPLGADDSPLVETWKKLVWHGGSVYDAWLNAASAQVGQVILTLPSSLAQLGYYAGIGFQLFYAALGCWTAYLLCCLLSEYRSRMERKGEKLREGHVTQYHEVMSSLVGSWAGHLSLFFNVISLLGLGVVQIIACASNVYYMNPTYDKRTWEIIFGGVALLTVLLPTFHNYRIWSFLGLVATTYTSWYMTAAAAAHGQVGAVEHRPFTSLQQFFTGSTNILFAFGGHSITVEIMHAMGRPRKFGWVYVFATLYTFTLTMPNSISVYWAYGDALLTKSNALGVLPPSPYRNTAIVLMIIHQCVAYGLFVTPLFLMWEKVVGVHYTKFYALRAVARVPVALLIWFLAVAFPFFGPINSIIGAFSTTFSTYLIPSLMYMIVYRTAAAKEACSQKPPTWIGRSFIVAYAFNIFVFVAVLVIGVGFGGWASLSTFITNYNTYGIFEKCYQCPVPTVTKA